MNQHYEAFRKKLQEIFMMDHAELDFGIYRIMNHKRNQINDFLDKQLLPQVEQTLKEYVKTDDSLQQELNKAIEGCKNLGIDPDTNPKVQQLRQQIAQSSTGVDDLQNTVFSRLTQFFSRYYEGGDFVSQRRYKTGGNSAYAIPYNGEEVKLYWANYDQYYIKTSEYFKNYTFKLRDGRRICFVLVDASTEQNNNKNTNGMERRFDILRSEEDQPVFEEVDGKLHISFTYELMPKATKQKDLNKKAFEALSAAVPAAWQELLMKEQVTDESVLLEKHINAYTAKNSFDYFIHKDLGGFLSRELDFYIKNEVFVIADLDAAKLQSQLAVVKAIEKVGQKIIDFLAQLENFQKRLWLKKKFVVQSDYCITLDRVPEKYYPEICANDEQRKEWVRLFAIDEIKGDGLFSKGYSEPLTVDFLKQNPFLVLDTKFFSVQFKHKLLAEIEDLDEQMNGWMIYSDNFHANRLLYTSLKEKVTSVFIDPPYNTGDNDFIYKDNYQSSSWLSMISDRVDSGMSLLNNNGVMFISIGDEEQEHLSTLIGERFGKDNLFSTLIWEKKKKGSFLNGNIAKMKDYVLCVSKNISHFGGLIGEIATDAETYPCVNADNPRDIRIIEKPIPSKYRKRNYKLEKGSTISAGNMTLVLHSDLVIKDGFLVPPLKIEGNWRYSQDSMDEYCEDGALYLTQDLYLRRIVSTPRNKRMKDLLLRTSDNSNEEYDFRKIDLLNLNNHGWGTNEDANDELLQVIGEQYTVSYPKPSKLIAKLLVSSRLGDGIYMDFFAGSGTTGQSILTLNRLDNGLRKYILVDMGEYFHTIALPRIKRFVYSEDWNNGKPVSRKGISQCFKYIRLEQYEDTLNNLEVNDGFGKPDNESYVLRYMLDTETRDSLINTKDFVRPFDYTIKTTRDNELVDTPVDLVDTFNYLIGLHVDSIHWHKDDNICVVEGTTHIEKEHVLVIWRNQDVIKNDDLNDFFRKQDYSTLDREFDVIYVNGDNTLPNIKSDEEHWKVRLIEQEMMKRMFEEE